MGPDLTDKLRTQAERFGTTFVTDDVTSADLTVSPKVVKVTEDTYLAETVVLATGSLRAGGSDVPDPLRAHQQDRVPPRRLPRLENHAGPGLRNEKITCVWVSEVLSANGQGELTCVTLRNLETGETSDLEVTRLFIAIGHYPHSDLVEDQVGLDDEAYVQSRGGRP